MTIKKLSILAVCIVAVGFLAVQLRASYVQESFPLICRGGGELHFSYAHVSAVADASQLWIWFEKGLTGVGETWDEQDLAPGQCSWFDRAIYANEPEHLVLIYPVFDDLDFSINWAEWEVENFGASADYIQGLQSPDEFQAFNVYNDGDGNFIVTEIGAGTYSSVNSTSPDGE